MRINLKFCAFIYLFILGGSSGQDIEEALKELKSMQQQLDEANEQILVMKTKGKYLFCICDP